MIIYKIFVFGADQKSNMDLFFVGVNFRGLAETEVFIDILIHGFDTSKLLLCIYVVHCVLNFVV